MVVVDINLLITTYKLIKKARKDTKASTPRAQYKQEFARFQLKEDETYNKLT